VKGDSDDGIGIHIAGGLIYTNTAGVAGKGIKTDLNIDVTGGKLFSTPQANRNTTATRRTPLRQLE
jgi:hypothetical protein